MRFLPIRDSNLESYQFEDWNFGKLAPKCFWLLVAYWNTPVGWGVWVRAKSWGISRSTLLPLFRGSCFLQGVCYWPGNCENVSLFPYCCLVLFIPKGVCCSMEMYHFPPLLLISLGNLLLLSSVSKKVTLLIVPGNGESLKMLLKVPYRAVYTI